MTPQEIQRLINLAYSQWPKLEPDPDAVIGWTRHLAGYGFDEAAAAVVDTWATATMPPSVADVLAVITGESEQIGWQDAWPTVLAIMARGGFRIALDAAQFPNKRAYTAAKSVQFDMRMVSAEKARWMFKAAYETAGSGKAAGRVELDPSSLKELEVQR